MSQRPALVLGKRSRAKEERSVLRKPTFLATALRGCRGEYRSGARSQAAARSLDYTGLPFPAFSGGCNGCCLVRWLGSGTAGYGSRCHLRGLSVLVAGRFLYL